MLKLLKYKPPKPIYVKFQRLVMGWLAIVSLFTQEINFVILFFILTAIGIISGTEYSPITLFYKFIKKTFSFDLIKISKHHIRYYQVNTSVDFIDHFLRIIASGSALVLYYSDLATITWGLIAFLSIFMMLSAYFGFCLSALSYILLQNFTTLNNTACNKNSPINKNCLLARHCFTPYKRCDNCHVSIKQCLGTKFNSVALLIGLAIALFLVLENRYFIQLNIIFIMGLLFWLGYQMNYNTDELAETNNENIELNKKLKKHMLSLEEEVQKRTSEIKHLVIHDQLTGVYNRYWFENKIDNAIMEVKDEQSNYKMAFLDLDKFKTVNDTGGHLAGDELLRRVTELIENTLPQKDFLARLGGDEFAILFESNDINEITNRCNEICRVINNYCFEWEENSFFIGVSIGLVDITKYTENMTELFRMSDKACYAAKNGGRNRVIVYSDNL